MLRRGFGEASIFLEFLQKNLSLSYLLYRYSDKKASDLFEIWILNQIKEKRELKFIHFGISFLDGIVYNIEI